MTFPNPMQVRRIRSGVRNVPHASPSPLNGERVGVRGENAGGSTEEDKANEDRCFFRCLLYRASARSRNHPSPSIPLPVEGRGKSKFATVVALFLTAAVHAATILEDFSSDPLQRGWNIFGDTNLFHWNATNQNLEVTWDSSRTNSYFQFPLGTILSKSDDFSLAFDLRVRDIAIGTSSNKPYTFEIAIGFLNSINSTNTNYFRGTGINATYGVRNAVEFDYFPATATVSETFAPTVISTNNRVAFSDNHPLELTANDLFHIAMTYTASNQTLKTMATRNGVPYGLPPTDALKDLVLTAHPDFRVDRVAIINYSDALQAGSQQFWGSVLAHGTVDNLLVTVPDSLNDVAGAKSNSIFRATFTSRMNWLYSLERSTDFATWTVASGTNAGTGTTLILADTNATDNAAFYRVRAVKP